MNKIRIYLVGIFLALACLVPALPASAVDTSSGSGGQACKAIGGISPGSGDSNCENTAGTSIEKLIELAVNTLSIIAGVIAVIMIIVAGLSYITAAGDAAKLSHAKMTLIYAIVGMVVVAVAQVLVEFTIRKAS